MKLLFLVTYLCLQCTSLYPQKFYRVTILPDSKITIKGASNINEFTCEWNSAFTDEVTICLTERNSDLIFNDSDFRLSVDKFKCENRYMTSDLRKTLQEETFPFINFELIRILNFLNDNLKNQIELKITIAGKTNKYCLDYEADLLNKTSYCINLSAAFDISDFGLEPPSAMMGLIKVRESITINLSLNITLQ